MKNPSILFILLCISYLFACKSKQSMDNTHKDVQTERNRLGPRGAMGSMDDFYDSMDLSDDQKMAMDEVNQAFRLKRATALKGNRDKQEQVNFIMQSLRKEQNAEVAKILDDAQYAKYMEFFNEYLDRRG